MSRLRPSTLICADLLRFVALRDSKPNTGFVCELLVGRNKQFNGVV